ncbi:MAG TPA: ABC transporter ATP-binding protein [Vicinamibacteria bacterium]|nr:ABC transporter ATP-binding protein [Vicinamibacteria bacterium]
MPGVTVLEIEGLSKSYRMGHLRPVYRPALSDLSLKVEQGEVFGYLGPNGSGKTTTLKVLMGLLHPDRGSALVLGSPLSERGWRYRVGYLPEHPYLYDNLTAHEYLDYVGRLFGLSRAVRRDRARHLLDLLGLARAADLPLRRFSKGMVQKTGIAQALMNEPDLVFLDEPMSGLDPMGRRLVRNLILDLKQRGKTVFFSTHILPDAETLCDRVALLRGGRLLREGRLDEILELTTSAMEVLVTGVDRSVLEAQTGLVAKSAVGERWRLEMAEDRLGAIVGAVEGAGGRILSVSPIRQSLEEYFFKEMAADHEVPVGGFGD